MMKASELQKQIRIGNYLLGKCIDDLDDRKEWWEIYKIQDAEHLMAVKEDWDKPIELTEEILLKCPDIENRNTNPISYYLHNRIIFINDGLCYDYATRVKLPYLHTFQNFIFALTSKELEIEL